MLQRFIEYTLLCDRNPIVRDIYKVNGKGRQSKLKFLCYILHNFNTQHVSAYVRHSRGYTIA
jgi:hypothetical protein